MGKGLVLGLALYLDIRRTMGFFGSWKRMQVVINSCPGLFLRGGFPFNRCTSCGGEMDAKFLG